MHARTGQLAILLLAVCVVLARLIAFGAVLVLRSMGLGPEAAIAQAVDDAVGVITDILMLFALLLVFDALRRIERESDRLQLFMDSVYRRLP
jgi:hypothetical protein